MNLHRILPSFCLLLSLNATATVRYVDLNSPGPTAPFTTWETAATTIQDAIDEAVAGDEILVTNGIYMGGGRAVFGTMTNRVVVDKAVSVRSVNGPQFTIIQGQQFPGMTNGIRCVYLTNWASLTGFTLTNGATRRTGDLLRERTGGGVLAEYNGVVSNCIVAGNWAAYFGGGAYGGTLYNCVLSGNATTNSGGGTCSNLLNNCTLSANSAMAGGGAFGAILKNSIVYFNQALSGSNYQASFLFNCCVAPLPAGGSGNLLADPLFLDGVGGNFRLQASSPCINAGDNADAPNGPDLDGNTRIADGTVDLGAYEYQGTPTPVTPYITLQPTNKTVLIGSNVIFAVMAGGTPPLRHQWLSNTVALINVTNATFTVTNAQLSHSGTLYSVTVTNVAGSVTSSNALLTVNSAPLVAPFITGQPTNRTVTVGSNVFFTVVAGGTAPLRYHWNLNGSTPSWATNASVTLTNVQLSQAGKYFVTITNVTGSIVSSNAVLTVQPVPVAGTRYVDANGANPTPPYTSWATAARAIQSAIDVALAGDEIIVTNGVYATGGRAVHGTMTNRVTVDKAVTVRSVNGPKFTLIEGRPVPGTTNGDGAIRCVYLTNGASLSGFALTNGGTRTLGGYQEQRGGGVFCTSTAASLSNCVLIGNSAWDAGGGAAGGLLRNCVLSKNSAPHGGGAADAALSNCALNGNSAVQGGGTRGGVLTNCTLIANSAIAGGGAFESMLFNCISYFNTAAYPASANHYGYAINFCCTTPQPYDYQGTQNITNDPGLASLTHLSAASPCRGAGNPAYARGADLDGEAWKTPPSIGCDELYLGAATGPLTVGVATTLTNVTPLYTVSVTAFIQGRTTASVWNFGDSVIVSNRPVATHAWTEAGDYPVVLTAYNDSNPSGVSATVIVHVVSAPIHYVSVGNANPSPPYSSWATAATNIQDAVDAATIPGAIVLVTNGVYAFGGKAVHGTMTNRVAVNKALTVRSVNGPENAAIQGWQLPVVTNGDGAIRCVYLTNGASLIGFTLTGGATRTNGDYATQILGGGAWCEPSGAVISNCVVHGNFAADTGGGVYRGLVLNSIIADNQARYGGGSAFSSMSNCVVTRNVALTAGGGSYGGALMRCWLTDNRAQGDGGGAYNGGLTNCAFTGNVATNGGGIYASYGGRVFGCTVASNSAVNGGGVYGFTNMSVNNSIIYFNTAANGSNYSGAPYGGIPVWFNSCCTAPSPSYGYQNITENPLFMDLAVRNLRLQSNSPCVEAGENYYGSTGPDLDGNPRIVGEFVDIGAYEYPDFVLPYFVTPPLDQTVTESLDVAFTLSVRGTGPFSYQWRFNGFELPGETNASLTLNHVQISQSGPYCVAVSNAAGIVISGDAVLTVNPAVTHYVDVASANPVAPFTSWETAAQTIQAAIDAAVGGDEIVVTNGLYATGGRAAYGTMTNRVAADRPLRIRSVNGARFTVIQGRQVPGTTNGDGAIRCVYLTNGASLSGFTLTNGATRTAGDTVYERSGGGLLSDSGVVSNCVVIGNSAAVYGGGVYNGTFYNCLIVGNSAESGGGGSGMMNNCTIVGNAASWQGGGAWGGRFKNCILYYNTAPTAPNYLYGSQDYCCTTPLPGGGIPNGGIMNLTTAPLFVNQAGGDFRPQSGSPCINAGNISFAPPGNDLDGNPRVRGTSVDIGAYEFQGSQPTLLISRSGESITLVWPMWASDFGLQQAGATPGYAGGWSNLNAIPNVATNGNTVTLPISGELELFRLYKP